MNLAYWLFLETNGTKPIFDRYLCITRRIQIMKKLPIFAISAAMLATSVAPSFAASSYSSVQSAARVIQVDDNWRRHDRDRRDGYHRSDWRDDRDNGGRRHHHGGKAAAIIGGVAAGAIIGGALAPDRRDRYDDDY